MEEIKYQQRIVAYIDILGFSQLIKKSANNNDILNKIYKALSHFIKEKEKNNEMDKRYSDNMCQYSTQSDCIVISYAFYKKSGSFFNILTDIYFMIAELSYLGFVARGGICIGKLYHNEQNVFGPALVDAVNLEEKSAHYPRIIISDKDYLKGIEEGYLFSSDEDREYINKRLKRDVDGYWYVDFFEQKSEFDWSYDFQEYLINWKTIIQNGLKENMDNTEVYSKYCWLASKFNKAIKRQEPSIQDIIY